VEVREVVVAAPAARGRGFGGVARVEGGGDDDAGLAGGGHPASPGLAAALVGLAGGAGADGGEAAGELAHGGRLARGGSHGVAGEVEDENEPGPLVGL
jgi:hypothetical protein